MSKLQRWTCTASASGQSSPDNVKRTVCPEGGSSQTHRDTCGRAAARLHNDNSTTDASRLRTRCTHRVHEPQVLHFEPCMPNDRFRRLGTRKCCEARSSLVTLQAHAYNIMTGKKLGEVSACGQGSTRQPDESPYATNPSRGRLQTSAAPQATLNILQMKHIRLSMRDRR